MIEPLFAALESLHQGHVLVVTGAGISHASGIDTFRGPDPEAVWSVSDVELATAAYFSHDPVGQWRWYLERFKRLEQAQPNAAHRALVKLEQWQRRRGGRFQLVTQNIDTLHEQAGSRELVKIHGTSDRLRCSVPGCGHAAPDGSLDRARVSLEPFRREPTESNLPRCPACNGLLRAHVLFFDEFYQEHRDYRFDDAIQASEEADLVLFAGTSFSVGITDLVARAGMRRRVPQFSIDPNTSPNARPYRIHEITEKAELALPALVARLSG